MRRPLEYFITALILFLISFSKPINAFKRIPRCIGRSKVVSVRKNFRLNSQLNAIDTLIVSAQQDIFGLIPLCIAATSKTTVTNDPSAGMTESEIVNYMSNVGGGMCGYPEFVRTFVGLGLNLGLIVFAFFTLSYGE